MSENEGFLLRILDKSLDFLRFLVLIARFGLKIEGIRTHGCVRLVVYWSIFHDLLWEHTDASSLCPIKMVFLWLSELEFVGFLMCASTEKELHILLFEREPIYTSLQMVP